MLLLFILVLLNNELAKKNGLSFTFSQFSRLRSKNSNFDFALFSFFQFILSFLKHVSEHNLLFFTGFYTLKPVLQDVNEHEGSVLEEREIIQSTNKNI